MSLPLRPTYVTFLQFVWSRYLSCAFRTEKVDALCIRPAAPNALVLPSQINKYPTYHGLGTGGKPYFSFPFSLETGCILRSAMPPGQITPNTVGPWTSQWRRCFQVADRPLSPLRRAATKGGAASFSPELRHPRCVFLAAYGHHLIRTSYIQRVTSASLLTERPATEPSGGRSRRVSPMQQRLSIFGIAFSRTGNPSLLVAKNWQPRESFRAILQSADTSRDRR